MKQVTVGNINGIRQGKRALAAPVTRADTYRTDEGWRSAADLEHGTSVAEVNHYGRHTTAKGDRLLVKAIDGDKAEVDVLDIRLVEPDKLTDQDFQALGYDNRTDYMTDWGDVFGPRIWLMNVRIVG
jgi:hypothetical protein